MKTTSAVVLFAFLMLSLVAEVPAKPNKVRVCVGQAGFSDFLWQNCEGQLTQVLRRRKRHSCRQPNFQDYKRFVYQCCDTACTLGEFYGYCCLN
ncbi:hypothetical protein AC249_AIPGENE2840 [Exaiptasia diaphana]|nr:hypothetical protein AC249_AIPGENE2840 [Exaiptasia diaphana]